MNAELNNCCFDEIWQRINNASKIVLLSHVRPDGDAIGSQIALGSILESMDKKVVLVNEDGPRKFKLSKWFKKYKNLLSMISMPIYV